MHNPADPTTTQHPRWRDRAECSGHLEPLWDDTVEGETPEDRSLRHLRAKIICRACPVVTACAAARRPGDGGIWAGQLYRQKAKGAPAVPSRHSGGEEAANRRAAVARHTRAGQSCEEIAAALDLHPRSVTRIRGRARTRKAG